MGEATRITMTLGDASTLREQPGQPCTLVIFGASGDLTKRLLMPALYNLACDRLLPKGFCLVGVSLDEFTSEQFREKMSADIRQFSTRKQFDEEVWTDLVRRLYYTPGRFDDPKVFERLGELLDRVGAEWKTEGNVLFYYATPPSLFGLISENLARVGANKGARGWRRVIVEKPFGHDLSSAIELNRALLTHWAEEQIYRIDHYLGKETVQNLLAFRFSNGIFEPLWNKSQVDRS
jgi:glucose-6-phosphate 1-dehydrogenase